MGFWHSLLAEEFDLRKQLEAEFQASTVTLFDKFEPNAGGQQRFFNMMPLNDVSDKPWRWSSIIGGIGCVAGETMIDGVPIAERSRPAMVDTLAGRAIATEAYVKGQADLYRVVTRSGAVVLVTLDHKFLTVAGWLKLRDLHIGGLIAGDSKAQERPGSSLCTAIFWDEISAIEFARHDDFYDLHVPVHNHYSAHGLWHHNSGKSYCGAAWATSRGLMAPECRGLITANTFGQLSRSTVITLVEVCREFNIPLLPYRESVEDHALAIVNAQRCYIGENRAFAYVLSMNSFTGKTQAARGLQVRWCWIDEGAYSDEQSFRTLDGRLGRGPGVMKGQGLITTSPAGFNWLYDRFGDPNRGADKERLYVMVNCATRENVKHLGADYVDGLTANYTEELAEQELEGAFINSMVGRVYKYVSRPNHALSGEEAEILAYEPSLPLHVTFDFNHSPAVALLAQVKGDEVHFFQEFYCMDSDTWELSELVCDHILGLLHGGDVYVYGDATGASRTANSKHTNWDIVFEAFKSIDIRLGDRLHKRFGTTNPRVTNRVNSVNCLAMLNRLFMDFANCKELVKDFEILTWSGEGIDKGDLLRSHLSDAAGYLVHKVFPYKAAVSRSSGKRGALPGIAS